MAMPRANARPRRRTVRVTRPPRADHRPGFTLIELLVVVSIVTALLGVLFPALSAVRSSARGLVCASNMKSVATEFTWFADGTASSGRGDSESLGRGRFRIDDFQESLYRIDEFWTGPVGEPQTLDGRNELMLCPAGATRLSKRDGAPCGSAAIGPVEDVSIGLNMRFRRATMEFKGKTVLSPVASTFVHTSVLNHPYAPIAMDVNGVEAQRRTLEPFYIAPPLNDVEDPYADGRHWFPASRHGGRVNAAFVGGHVLSSANPAGERWDWSYQAEVGR